MLVLCHGETHRWRSVHHLLKRVL